MKALVTYEIPPLRSLNWTIAEDEDPTAKHTFETIRDHIEAENPGWRVKTVLIDPDPEVEPVPKHLAHYFATSESVASIQAREAAAQPPP